jgi:hypothetical protein
MIKGPLIFTAIISIFLLAFLMNGFANLLESQPLPPNQKFEVIEQYKGCDVIRYTPDHSARYTYFLNCKNE